jgi:hypothetical protein
MIFLFNQHWDIIPGKEEEYTQFAINHYIPTMKKIGINPVGGFHVVVGEGPRVISVGTMDSLQKLQNALETEEYEKVTAQIQRYVFNYFSRILKPTGRVKIDKYTVQLRVWKFNQYFNIIPGKEKEYTKFVTKDHIPTMEKLDMKIIGGWQVLVGPGPYIVAEATARSIVDIAKVLESDEYKRITNHLTSTYVTDYSSRILAPTGRIELPYLLGKMMKAF